MKRMMKTKPWLKVQRRVRFQNREAKMINRWGLVTSEFVLDIFELIVDSIILEFNTYEIIISKAILASLF